MGYFRELPNLLYKSFLTDKKSSLDYIEVKNLFRRVKLRDDLHNVLTIFDKYQIPQGSRPELVAEEFYGDRELDWVVCMTAGIINVRQDWPLSDKELWYYAENKYGNDLNNVRHYETTEVKDENKRLILPKGKVVDSTFTIPDPDNPQITLSLSSPNPLIIGISNYLSETRQNERKRNIKVMREEYLTTFLLDMRDSLKYTKSSQYQSPNLVS